jgi:hypothetical protein
VPTSSIDGQPDGPARARHEGHSANAGTNTDIVSCLGCDSGAPHDFWAGTMRSDVFLPFDGFRGLDIDINESIYINDSSNPAPNIDMRVYIYKMTPHTQLPIPNMLPANGCLSASPSLVSHGPAHISSSHLPAPTRSVPAWPLGRSPSRLPRGDAMALGTGSLRSSGGQ